MFKVSYQDQRGSPPGGLPGRGGGAVRLAHLSVSTGTAGCAAASPASRPWVSIANTSIASSLPSTPAASPPTAPPCPLAPLRVGSLWRATSPIRPSTSFRWTWACPPRRRCSPCTTGGTPPSRPSRRWPPAASSVPRRSTGRAGRWATTTTRPTCGTRTSAAATTYLARSAWRMERGLPPGRATCSSLRLPTLGRCRGTSGALREFLTSATAAASSPTTSQTLPWRCGALRAAWRRPAIFPGVRFPGLNHAGLIGTAPSAELLAEWNAREGAPVASGEERLTLPKHFATRPLASLPEPAGALLGAIRADHPDHDRIAAEAARTIPGRENGGNGDIQNLTVGAKVYLPATPARRRTCCSAAARARVGFAGLSTRPTCARRSPSPRASLTRTSGRAGRDRRSGLAWSPGGTARGCSDRCSLPAWPGTGPVRGPSVHVVRAISVGGAPLGVQPCGAWVGEDGKWASSCVGR